MEKVIKKLSLFGRVLIGCCDSVLLSPGAEAPARLPPYYFIALRSCIGCSFERSGTKSGFKLLFEEKFSVIKI